MFVDNRHKGLATYRAARAERKEIAILVKQVAESNPEASEKECRQLAQEIRAARIRAEEAKKEAEKKKARKSRRGVNAKGKGKPKDGKVQRRRRRKGDVDMSKVEVYSKGSVE